MVMSTPPEWASGLPIEIEVFAAERYSKDPPAGSTVVKARNGQLLESAR